MKAKPTANVPGQRYDAGEGEALLSGAQALVRLPMDQRRADIAAGLCTAGFITGYPGSPLAGYDVELERQQRWLADLGIVHQCALNEELGATAISGSQLASLQPGVEVWDRSRILAAEEALARVHGVTVLVHDQECAAERGRRERRTAAARTRRVFINPLACDGCGDCGMKSNCVAVRPVHTALGRRTEIHQESCNLDYTCLEGDCPALITVEPASRPMSARQALDAATLPPPRPATQQGAFTVRITGIGGTGVVTTARIIAAAAQLSGLPVRGLDQTGIAQKGGSVCSDLRIGPGPAAETHRLGAGECDLYLGCDLLVAAEPRHLGVASPDRTVAVMSSYAVPTGREVADRSVTQPEASDLRARVERRTQAAASVWIDAQELSRRRFGSDVYANILLLGAAYQQGALPLDPGHLEEAIRLGGVAAEVNVQAFRYGRLIAAEPTKSRSSLGEDDTGQPALDAADAELVRLVGAAPGSELEQIAGASITDLVAYQDRAYARRYAETVARCRDAEETRCGIADGPFARAVAVQLHRLMAYRDEYEVARLHRSPVLRAELDSRFGPGARVQYHLSPPLLRRLGLKGKVTVGRGAGVAFGVLTTLRRLRGTPLDLLGYTELHRLERELRDDYLTLVTRLCDSLGLESYARAVKIAELPDEVRGYGQVKATAIRQFRSRLDNVAADTGDVAPVGSRP